MRDDELERIFSFVSPWTGIVRTVDISPDPIGISKLAYFRTQVGTYPEMKFLNPGIFGGGGFRRRDAVLSSIAEGLERYSACMAPYVLEIKAANVESMRASGEMHLDPIPAWPIDENQQPEAWIRKPDLTESINWVRGVRVDDGHEAWIPEFLVTLKAEKNLHWAPTTNGCAVGISAEDAARRALFELIERDAILENWWLNKSPVRLDPVELSAMSEFSEELEILSTFRSRMQIYVLEKDHGIPAVLCLLFGRGPSEPAVLTGAKAHTDLVRAIKGAVSEAAGLFRSTCLWGTENWRGKARTNVGEVRGFTEHWIYYADPKNLSAFDSFQNGPVLSWREAVGALAGLKSKAPSWTELRAILRQHGYHVYLADITSRELRSKGLHCMRAVSFDFIPLNSSHRHRSWGTPRLRTQVAKLEDFNPYPHPVP